MSTVMGRVLLFSFCVFIALGNLPRVIIWETGTNNLSLSELILYVLSIVSLGWVRIRLRYKRAFWIFTGLVLASFFYGAMQNGFDGSALGYSIRLIALLGSGIILGHFYAGSLQEKEPLFLVGMLYAYVVAASISIGIYVLFPDSEMLWAFLRRYHVHFIGDPHQQRLISVYLDPNFYAAIATLPFLLSLFLFLRSRKLKYAFYACMFANTILCSCSRSGVMLFWMICAYLGWLFLKKRSQAHWTRKIRIAVLLFWGSVLGVAAFKSGGVMERIGFISEDASAGYRWLSFLDGWELLLDSPLLGVGYSFAQVLGVRIDASLLVVLVSFGVCLGSALLASFAYFLYRLRQRFRGEEGEFFVTAFVVYVILTVVFFSWFNHILFYPFWALPVVALSTVLDLEHETRRNNASATF